MSEVKLPVEIGKPLDDVIDKLENWVKETENKIDDFIVLGLLMALRSRVGLSEEAGSPYEDKPSEDAPDGT